VIDGTPHPTLSHRGRGKGFFKREKILRTPLTLSSHAGRRGKGFLREKIF